MDIHIDDNVNNNSRKMHSSLRSESNNSPIRAVIRHTPNIAAAETRNAYNRATKKKIDGCQLMSTVPGARSPFDENRSLKESQRGLKG